MFNVKKKPKITSVQFELQVKRFLESTAGKLKDFQTVHRESMDGQDGIYEIDITARFRIFGADFLVLVECKNHKNHIKREHVQMLHAKQVSLSAKSNAVCHKSVSGQRCRVCEPTWHCFGPACVRRDSVFYKEWESYSPA